MPLLSMRHISVYRKIKKQKKKKKSYERCVKNNKNEDNRKIY